MKKKFSVIFLAAVLIAASVIFGGCSEFLKVLRHNDDEEIEIIGAFVFDLPSPIAIVVKRAGKVGEVELLAYLPLVEEIKKEAPFVFFTPPWPEAQRGRFLTSSPITKWRGSVGKLSGMGISSQGISAQLLLELRDDAVIWEIKFLIN